MVIIKSRVLIFKILISKVLNFENFKIEIETLVFWNV